MTAWWSLSVHFSFPYHCRSLTSIWMTKVRFTADCNSPFWKVLTLALFVLLHWLLLFCILLCMRWRLDVFPELQFLDFRSSISLSYYFCLLSLTPRRFTASFNVGDVAIFSFYTEHALGLCPAVLCKVAFFFTFVAQIGFLWRVSANLRYVDKLSVFFRSTSTSIFARFEV